jgi:hypothetical protein
MKKIKYILLILAIGFSVTACYDDDPINKVVTQGLTDITLSVASSSTVTAEGFGVPFTASIPNTFSSDVDVEASLKFQGGIVNTLVTIPAGSTSADGSIQMQSNDGLNKFSGRPVALSLTGLAVSGAVAGEPTVFNITSNEINITSYDRVQWPYGSATIAGRMTALFDWGDPANNDLDMLIFRDDFTQVEGAASGSRWETDIFNDTHADGNYFVAIDFWIASGDIPWKIFFVHPDQTTVTSFEGTFVGAQDGDFVFPLINFTKTTDGSGVVTYTFSQP